MDWLKQNWKKLAKYGGVGAGCFVVLVLGFILARYISSGDTYESPMIHLAPADCTYVVTVDNVPNRNRQIDSFLGELVENDQFSRFERTSLWRDLTTGDEVSEDTGKKPEAVSVETLLQDKKKGLNSARSSLSDELGAELFTDVLAGELILCMDPAKDEASASEWLVLQRVTRPVRFKWQFLDIAGMFLPDNVSFDDGVLAIENPDSAPMYLSLLGDVLAIGNSTRLVNGAINNFNDDGKNLPSVKKFKAANDLVDSVERKNYAATIWINLDRLRSRVPSEPQDDGTEKSPIDTFNTLPAGVVSIFPDIFAPLNRIVTMNLDARIYDTALYGLNLSDASQVKFDQYLLVNEERAEWEQFAYLKKTLKTKPRTASQLELLPDDTMLQTSYAQEFDVMYNSVLDESARTSLVGDFMVALNTDAMRMEVGSVTEMMFAMLPTKYAAMKADFIPGTELPIPPFAMAFRTASGQEESAKLLLQEYLAAQRGRVRKPGATPNPNAVTVVERLVAQQIVYGLNDPRQEDNMIRRLNRSLRTGLVGDWLILTNSEKTLAYAIEATTGKSKASVSGAAGFSELPSKENATLFLNMAELVGYLDTNGLYKKMRSNKYNPTLPEGQDPGAFRRSIAESFGLDPTKQESLKDSRVTNEYNIRKARWEQTCVLEGNKYEADLRSDIVGLKFFKDLALITQFHGDYMHVSGVLRLNN
ncbi:hypothetical protein OAU50_07805 [Planctomycetota bacterium]|nr:hypothetical protein [Planctomycetota bacterium]